MVSHLVKSQARRAEHFVTQIAALGMGLAYVGATVAASRGSIVTARITARVLNTRNLDDRALHGWTP